MGQHMKVDPNLPDEAYTREAYQRYLKRYLRCVKGIDDNLGRLLKHLEQSGELDNTVIMYTSDQGMMLGEHDYMDKRWMYEESYRMPFIVRWPETVAAGSTADALVNNTDFAPTILDIAGQTTPDSMQGRSFLPILAGKGEPEDWRTSTYYRYWMHMAHHENPAHYGVRTKRYKLIFFYGLPLDAEFWRINPWNAPTGPHWELYDLAKDPHEMSNVYGDPAYADVTKELKAELLRLKREVGDIDEKYPELMKVREKYW
jgi:arylsulfatase A-like enzyme